MFYVAEFVRNSVAHATRLTYELEAPASGLGNSEKTHLLSLPVELILPACVSTDEHHLRGKTHSLALRACIVILFVSGPGRLRRR